MPTPAFTYPPAFKVVGYDSSYYLQFTVQNTTFGTQGGSINNQSPTVIIPFLTAGVILTNLSSSGTVQYSTNGETTHGQLTGYSSGYGINQQLVYYNRIMSAIWFCIPAGGSCLISVEAWKQQ